MTSWDKIGRWDSDFVMWATVEGTSSVTNIVNWNINRINR